MKLPELLRKVVVNRVENTTKTSNVFGSDCLKEFQSVHKRESAGRGPVTFMLEFPGPILDGKGNLSKLRDHERGNTRRGYAHGACSRDKHFSCAAYIVPLITCTAYNGND